MKRMCIKGRAAGIFIVLLALAVPASMSAVEGEVVYIEGFAWIDRDSTTIEADFGEPVFQNDIVTTAPGGLVIIELPRGRELKLRENTVLEMSSFDEEVSIDLREGSLFSKVSKGFGGFEVRAQSVVAGVRGTEFFVAYGRFIDAKPDIWLCVNEGEVDVTVADTGESVTVEEGKGINIVGGTTLTNPRRYPWTLKLNWNMDPNAGGVLDDTDLDQAYEDLLDQDYD
jgi:hypothetical protein